MSRKKYSDSVWRETFFFSSGATDLQGLGQQSGRRRSAKLVPSVADRGVSRGQRSIMETNKWRAEKISQVSKFFIAHFEVTIILLSPKFLIINK